MKFRPGNLHFSCNPLYAGEIGYKIDLKYDVRKNSGNETVVHFEMNGVIDSKVFSESFELPSDVAYNFASNVSRVAMRHGLPSSALHPEKEHLQYDQAFNDIREKLQASSGTPVKPEHLT